MRKLKLRSELVRHLKASELERIGGALPADSIDEMCGTTSTGTGATNGCSANSCGITCRGRFCYTR